MTQSHYNPKIKKEDLNINKKDNNNKRKKKEKIEIEIRDNETDKIISEEYSSSLNNDIDVSSILSPEENKEFKKIQSSKNKDMLKKNHGCQNIVNNLNKLKNLVDHTNRLFMYKSKMGCLPPKNNKFDNVIEDRFLSSDTTVNTHRNTFSKDKIVSRLDKLIASIDLNK
jgi:hypothetical protein